MQLILLEMCYQDSIDCFSEIFNVCDNMLEKLNISVTLPGLSTKMSKKSNPNVTKPIDLYRIDIFILFIVIMYIKSDLINHLLSV